MATIDDHVMDLMEQVARLREQVANMIRHGPVTHVDAEKQLLRVRLNPDTEKEPYLSAWTPYLQQAGEYKFHNPPSVGQNITILAPGGNLPESIAIPFTWSDGYPSPSKSPDEHVITFGSIRMTFKKEEWSIAVGNASVTIQKDKNVLVKADDKIQEKAGDKILNVKKDRIETVKDTYLGLDKEGENAPLGETEWPYKQTYVKLQD